MTEPTREYSFDELPESMHDTGLVFGYPRCCVDAFCKSEHLKDKHWRSRPLIGTGFVCCAECAETKTAEELSDEIKRHRRVSWEFMDNLGRRR